MQKEELDLISRRVNLSAQAREFKKNGLPLANNASPDPLDSKRLSFTEAVPIWLAHVHEAMAITSVLSEIVIDRAISLQANYPPYGLLKYGERDLFAYEPVTRMATLEDQTRSMKQSLGIAQFISMDELNVKRLSNDQEPMVHLFARYLKLFNFARDNIAGSSDAIIDINGGINTAVYRMGWTLMNILELYQQNRVKNLTIEDFQTTARNSWPHIVKVASMHRHNLQYASPGMSEHMLVKANNGYHIEYIPESETKMRERAIEAKLVERDKHPTFGCPALVNFNGGSPIRKLWDWQIDLVGKIYQKNHRGRSVYRLLAE